MKKFAIFTGVLIVIGCTKSEVVPQSSVRYSIQCASCFVQYQANGVNSEKHFATSSWTFSFMGSKGGNVNLRATNENLNGGNVTVSIFINENLFQTHTSKELIIITDPAYFDYRTSASVYGLIP